MSLVDEVSGGLDGLSQLRILDRLVHNAHRIHVGIPAKLNAFSEGKPNGIP
jgi:hypothetical protein